MAPYISSHLRDRVWIAQRPSALLDILQNLVANTRMEQSPTHMVVPVWFHHHCWLFLWWIALSFCEDQRP